MRVHIVDPSAYTPPYDHALCRALAAAGAQVELFTSRFAYATVAPAEGYVRREHFYRLALGAPGGRLRSASKLVQHVPDMLRYRRAARAADVVHVQWLAVQQVDGWLLPRGRPLVLSAHDVLPREPRWGQRGAQRRLYERFDAIVVHSRHGRERLRELGVSPERIHVIPHGAFAHLVGPAAPAPAPAQGWAADRVRGGGSADPRTAAPGGDGPAGAGVQAPPRTDGPVALCFGLMRPYKGIDVLLAAWRELDTARLGGAQLWIVGMPRMDISKLRAAAPASVRWDTRFVPDRELAAYFERADLVVAPYLQADQSGVLFTALAFGKPLLLSDVGGFPELADTGAVRVTPAGEVRALSQALRELLADRAALRAMGAKALQAARGRYSWEQVAQAHLQLYERLVTGRESPGSAG